ncbi:hypothetical protein L2E82_36164 [Cichorium intybus]|uniref:Uncharacterized protein n=1 Tax=Cichorium intybus TaxID=13427 RepID=A0ACB9BR04_CICIN|nr:hypothetical protein L2E82_36164 [Cichorium intybus]
MYSTMDAFYAAVEALSNPSLKGKPMAVGNMSMISTANYEARKFGVRAAMPGFIAFYHEYDPNFTYLDITKVCKEKGITGGKVAEELRENVYKATGLTCSAGIAPNRLLAKVYSDINKPNRQFIGGIGLRLGGTDPPNVRSRKSISNEITFSATKNEAFFNQKSVELADKLSADMEKECLHGRTFTLKLKTASFEINPDSARG